MELSIRGTSLWRVVLYGAATYIFFCLPLMAQRVEKPQRSQVQSAAAVQPSGNQANSDGKPLGVLPVLGKGTANAIPVWTGTYTIGNSILSQSGGTLTVSGSVSARTFMGDGSAVTNVNANLLDGLSSSAFVQAGASNTFTGDQTITGNLNVSGFFNNALYLQGNLTDSTGEQGANVLGGFTGLPGFPGNSIAPGVIGATIAGGGGTYFPAARAVHTRPELSRRDRTRLRRLAGSAASEDSAAEQPTAVAPNGLTSAGNVVQALSNWSTIGGGLGNTTSGTFSTVAGGDNNSSVGTQTTVGGGSLNKASSTTAGSAGASTVAGGESNTASADFASVGGGSGNIAGADHAVVAGGEANNVTGDHAVVAGGLQNTAASAPSVIFGNTEGFSAVSGGLDNYAGGAFSVVPGGYFNAAVGEGTFVGGCQAEADYPGTFMWASMDTTQSQGGCSAQSLMHDTGPSQFIVQASGGFFLYSGFRGQDLGVTLPSGSGSWSSTSDRNTKANFAVVDTSSLLAKIAALPLSTWNYKAQAETIRHLGPMAQDFRSAFGLGEDDKHISTIDSEGVSLAGIQALYKLSQEKDQKIAELARTVEDLTRRLVAIEAARH